MIQVHLICAQPPPLSFLRFLFRIWTKRRVQSFIHVQSGGKFGHSFISFISNLVDSFHSFIHVQSGEKIGTRKKRKENMRKATDVEMKTIQFIF